MNNAELKKFVTTLTAAQSMLLASVIRPFIVKDIISPSEIGASLAATERAALERRTDETSALTGLIDLLRRDLGLAEGNHRDPA